jgi:SAM-dependent methyltransferase
MADTQVVYEHLHRYHFAKLVAADRRVLDLGSGEGYGSAILAETAADVLGVDIDAEAIEHARRTYARPNLRFEIGSIEALGTIPDDAFDVVVCFEVIEHVREHDPVIAAVRRVLSPGGVFLVSTPDRDRYNAGRPPNPFHVRELSRDELCALLDTTFSTRALWTQHLAVGSAFRAVAPERTSGSHTVTVNRTSWGWETVARESEYLLAAASDRALPELPALSLLEDRGYSIMRGAPPGKDKRLRGSLARLIGRRRRQTR